MNWTFILLQIVVFLGLISFMIAAIYYVRHRHSKAVSIKEAMNATDPDDGGKYLKRYIPPEHRSEKNAPRRSSLFASKPLFYGACTLIPALFLGFIGFNYYANRSDFLADIILDSEDLQGIPEQSHDFVLTTGMYAPALNKAVKNISSATQFVVFKKKRANNYQSDQWVAFLESNRLKHKTCFYQRLRSCKINSSSIAVISLEHTDENLTDRLLSKNASIWAYGFPTNIPGDNTGIPNLSFANSAINDVSELAVVGDRELTLGLDAGLHFPLSRPRAGILVSSSNPQAISMFTDGKAGGERNVRLHADSVDDSRIVWMDFPISDFSYLDVELQAEMKPLFGNILRYLTKQEYGTIATWPQGKKYAAFVEQDTEDGYKVSSKVAKFFRDNQYPVTWYALSDLAQKYRGVSNDLAKTGEMACHGDNHDIFTRYSLKEQGQRLARCIKVIEQVTGQRPAGFRPPTEAHNNNTLSAVLNVGMTHVFAESWTRALVPHLKISKQTGKSLVSLPRAITDDYYLWPTLNLNEEQSVSRMMDELEWIRATGTLYGFSFHTQFMLDKSRFNVVKTISHAVNRDNVSWVSTVGDISDWWRVRHNLIVGTKVSMEEYNRYQPMTLFVDKNGSLNTVPTSAKYATRSTLNVAEQIDD